jgi:hypothetical protein
MFLAWGIESRKRPGQGAIRVWVWVWVRRCAGAKGAPEGKGRPLGAKPRGNYGAYS